MALTKAQRDAIVKKRGSGTWPMTPESLRQSMLHHAGITDAEQAKLAKRVWKGIHEGLDATDIHVSVVDHRVEHSVVPNHSARAKARDQALDIIGIRAPRANAVVSTKVRVNINMPDWANPAKDNIKVIDAEAKPAE